MRNFWFKLTIFGAVMLAFGVLMADSSWAQNKGGGKGGGGGGSDPPPSPESPLKYRLHLSEPVGTDGTKLPSMNSVNVHGVAVGRFTNPETNFLEAILFDSLDFFGGGKQWYLMSEFVNLTNLDPDSEAAQTLALLPNYEFRSINDDNQIVGYFRKDGDTQAGRRAFVLDLSRGIQDATWDLLPIQDELVGTKLRIHQSAWEINDNGVAVVACWDPTDFESFDRYTVYLVDVDTGFNRLVTFPDTDEPILGASRHLSNTHVLVRPLDSSSPKYLVEFDNEPFVLDDNGFPVLNENYLRAKSLEVLPIHVNVLSGVSNQGTTTGSETVTVQLRGNKTGEESQPRRVLRYEDADGNVTFDVTPINLGGGKPNRQGDLLFWQGEKTSFRGSIFMAWDETPSLTGLEVGEYIDVESLIVADPGFDTNFWFNSNRMGRPTSMANRDANGYGKIGGSVWHAGLKEWRLFVLVPEVTLP